MDKFLETHNLPKRKQEEIENFNRPITGNTIESVIKKFPKNKFRTRWFHKQMLPNI